jgi:hypothetical protein
MIYLIVVAYAAFIACCEYEGKEPKWPKVWGWSKRGRLRKK